LINPIDDKIVSKGAFSIKVNALEIDRSKYVSRNLTLKAITKGYKVALKPLILAVCSKQSMVASEGAGFDLILPKESEGSKHIIKAKDYEDYLKVIDC
jgi:hypothetical protein